MTTITINSEEKIPKTKFETFAELIDWAVDYFADDSPLSDEIIEKYRKAKEEKDSPQSTFKEVL